MQDKIDFTVHLPDTCMVWATVEDYQDTDCSERIMGLVNRWADLTGTNICKWYISEEAWEMFQRVDHQARGMVSEFEARDGRRIPMECTARMSLLFAQHTIFKADKTLKEFTIRPKELTSGLGEFRAMWEKAEESDLWRTIFQEMASAAKAMKIATIMHQKKNN